MIVIEGTDNLGKTTLANAVVARLNEDGFSHIYRHFSKLPESFNKVWGYLPYMHRNSVMDRFYLSRQAYGKALKNQETLSREQLRWLDANLRLHAGFTVLVTASDERIKADWQGDKGKDEMYSLKQAIAVNGQFRRLFALGDADVDIHIELQQSDWPTDYLDRIVQEYHERYVAVEAVYERLQPKQWSKF